MISRHGDYAVGCHVQSAPIHRRIDCIFVCYYYFKCLFLVLYGNTSSSVASEICILAMSARYIAELDHHDKGAFPVPRVQNCQTALELLEKCQENGFFCALECLGLAGGSSQKAGNGNTCQQIFRPACKCGSGCRNDAFKSLQHTWGQHDGRVLPCNL